jgi:uncharacterized protein (TIGR02246 family)
MFLGHARRIRWTGLLVISVMVVLSSVNTARAAAGQTRDTPIRALHDAMIEAYNHGDATGAAAGFASGGALVTGDATRYVTPPEIERYLSRLLSTLPKGTRFLATITDVQMIGPDIAVLASEGGWLCPATRKSQTRTGESRPWSRYRRRARGAPCCSRGRASPFLHRP